MHSSPLFTILGGGSLYWGLCLGGVSVEHRKYDPLNRDPQIETPWYSEEWVVRILLECILVHNDFLSFQSI